MCGALELPTPKPISYRLVGVGTTVVVVPNFGAWCRVRFQIKRPKLNQLEESSRVGASHQLYREEDQ
jgi:hypothetical protein